MYEGQNSPHLIGFVPTSMFTYIALRKIRLRIYVCQLVQAGAMRLVCDYTLLPFPKIYDAYVDESADRGGRHYGLHSKAASCEVFGTTRPANSNQPPFWVNQR
ncbi:hypothetical protein PABG_11672 [Paracoccidioides brasiliensis Pb03]|nr:hypothetical protein PABG_11672 [Paracoccidioides brasiliensis Pb03]